MATKDNLGEYDDFFIREDQDTLISLIPNVTFKFYEGTGHGTHWEKPQEFVNDLEEFMNS